MERKLRHLVNTENEARSADERAQKLARQVKLFGLVYRELMIIRRDDLALQLGEIAQQCLDELDTMGRMGLVVSDEHKPEGAKALPL